MGSIGWLMVCHPSTLRIWICPETSSAQSSIGTVSGHGSTVCVLILRRNSPLRRSMALVVLADFHCDGLRVSREGGHRFHLILGTDFTRTRALISRERGH